VTLLRQGVGLEDPQRSLPTPNILGFCCRYPSAGNGAVLQLPTANLAGHETHPALGLSPSTLTFQHYELSSEKEFR